MMAGAAAVHGSLMRLVVEHHGLHAGFGSAHGALGVVDGQQHGGVGLTAHQAGNRVHLLELGLGLFGMATGAGGGAGHNRGLNGGGFGGGLGLHFLGGKLLRALGLGGLLGFHLSGQIRTRGLGHVFMAPHALGVHGGLERRRGTNGLFAVAGGAGVFLSLLPYELVQLFVIHMVANAAVFFGVGRVDDSFGADVQIVERFAAHLDGLLFSLERKLRVVTGAAFAVERTRLLVVGSHVLMATDATIMIDVFQLLGVGAVFLALEFDGVPVRGGRMTDRTVLARGSESLGVFVMQKHGGRHFQLLELAYGIDADHVGAGLGGQRR